MFLNTVRYASYLVGPGVKPCYLHLCILFLCLILRLILFFCLSLSVLVCSLHASKVMCLILDGYKFFCVFSAWSCFCPLSTWDYGPVSLHIFCPITIPSGCLLSTWDYDSHCGASAWQLKHLGEMVSTSNASSQYLCNITTSEFVCVFCFHSNQMFFFSFKVANLSLYAVALTIFSVSTSNSPADVENQVSWLKNECILFLTLPFSEIKGLTFKTKSIYLRKEYNFSMCDFTWFTNEQYRWIAYSSIFIGCCFVGIFHLGTEEPRFHIFLIIYFFKTLVFSSVIDFRVV